MRKLAVYGLPILIGCIALGLTLYNIMGFPMMVGDEGIYVSQAWWLAKFHALGPYTYWYDHFPLGWLQIGLWQSLTGGPFTFGLSVFSSRIMMAILKAVSVVILFALVRKTTKNNILAVLSGLFYTLSPLALTFNRQVLLDNIATFWLLIHVWISLKSKLTGKNLFLASLTLALAILSKESLLFILPVYLILVTTRLYNQTNSRYKLLVAYLTVFFPLTFFPLLSLLKGELFPAQGAVSFLGTLAFQGSRGSGVPFWINTSDFAQSMKIWLQIDPLLILSGIGSLAFSLFFLWKNIAAQTISLYALAFSFFLIRGGLVYDFYIIPLIPLFVLSLTYTVDHVSRLLNLRLVAPLIIILACGYYGLSSRYMYTTAATANQIRSIEYVDSKATTNDSIVADNYAYLDLALNKNGEPKRSHVEWYSKAETDTAIRLGKLGDDPQNIDYLIVNDFLDRKIYGGELPFLKSARDQLTPLQTLGSPSNPTAKPYTNESVTVYGKDSQMPAITSSPEDVVDNHFILTFSGTGLDEETAKFITSTAPFGLLIGFQNVANSSQLESLMNELKSAKSAKTLLITRQSDSGTIAIPWITTVLRASYKSVLEAQTATEKKAEALAEIGFQAIITTTATDADGFLNAITKGVENKKVIPILEIENPTLPIATTPYLVISKKEIDVSLQEIKQKGIYLSTSDVYKDFITKVGQGYDKFVIDLKEYQQIRSQIIDLYQANPAIFTK